jgi:hypothetical protein
MKREYITRRAPDLEEVAAYMTAVEEVGGQMVSITTEGTSQYPTALMPHTNYRIWAFIPQGTHDRVDNIADKILGVAFPFLPKTRSYRGSTEDPAGVHYQWKMEYVNTKTGERTDVTPSFQNKTYEDYCRVFEIENKPTILRWSKENT